jgi:outer membrane protein OmpA-like peptidoglycan-associated protein
MPPYHRNIFRTRYFFRQQAARERSPSGHWLLDYIKKNPIQSGLSLATLYGVLAIFAYHFHIDYFPSFDLKSLASIVLAAAYTTLLTLIACSFCLIAPCYFIAAFVIDKESKKDERKLVAQIAASVVSGYFISIILCACLLVIFDRKLSGLWIVVVIPILMLLLAVRPVWQSVKASLNRDPALRIDRTMLWGELRGRAGAWLKLAKVVPGTAFSEIFTLIITFLFLLRDSPLAQGKEIQWLNILNFMYISGAVLHGAMFYLLKAWCSPNGAPQHRLYSVVAALAAPICMSFFAQNPGLFFSLTAMTTKIGNFRAAELTVSDNACRIVANSGGGICTKLGDGSNKLCNVHVMSRLGTETYLLVSFPHVKATQPAAQNDPDKPVPRPEWVRDVYIPSKEILGMKLDPAKRYLAKQAMENGMADETSQCANVPKPVEAPKKTEKTFDGAQLFAFDLYSLSPSGQKVLDEFLQRLIAEKASTMAIKVVGHADAIGNDYHNLQLSQLRALTVANYLKGQLKDKVKIVNVEWIGVGSSQKKTADDACPANAKQAQRVMCLEPDRRVEITAAWSKDATTKP